MRSPPLLPLAVVIALATASRPARADLPGPRTVCAVDGLHCESCWQHYGSDAEQTAQFNACRDGLVAKGLVQGCSERAGAGQKVYFCPAGTKPETKVVGGGCAGCATGGGALPGGLAALALTLGLAALRRRRRPPQG